jgi:hypothetical protein
MHTANWRNVKVLNLVSARHWVERVKISERSCKNESITPISRKLIRYDPLNRNIATV